MPDQVGIHILPVPTPADPEVRGAEEAAATA